MSIKPTSRGKRKQCKECRKRKPNAQFRKVDAGVCRKCINKRTPSQAKPEEEVEPIKPGDRVARSLFREDVEPYPDILGIVEQCYLKLNPKSEYTMTYVLSNGKSYRRAQFWFCPSKDDIDRRKRETQTWKDAMHRKMLIESAIAESHSFGDEPTFDQLVEIEYEFSEKP